MAQRPAYIQLAFLDSSGATCLGMVLAPSGLGPPKSIKSQDSAPPLPTDQSNLSDSSIEVLF